MCVYVCLFIEPVSRSKDDVRSCIKTGSVVSLCNTPVSPSVRGMEGIIYAIREHRFLRVSPWWSLCTLYSSHARWSYRRRLGFLLLLACVQCHMWRQMFERNYFPLFVDFTNKVIRNCKSVTPHNSMGHYTPHVTKPINWLTAILHIQTCISSTHWILLLHTQTHQETEGLVATDKRSVSINNKRENLSASITH